MIKITPLYSGIYDRKRLFVHLLAISFLAFSVISTEANDLIVIKKSEQPKDVLRKAGLGEYAKAENFKKLLKYNEVETIIDDIGLMIPPIECLGKENEDPLCSPAYGRSLRYLDSRFLDNEHGAARDTPIHFLDELNRKKKVFRILELGSGVGVLLVESQMRFPQAEISGINYEPHGGIVNASDLKKVAVLHKKATPDQWDQLKNSPKLIFKDLDQGRMDFFKENSFDAILSQSTLQYLSRKDVILKEIYRVLSPGGRAYLDLKNINVDGIKDPIKSFHAFADGLIKSNPRIRISAPKRLRLILEKLDEKGADQLIIPFTFVKSISPKKDPVTEAYQYGESEGIVTYLKSIP